MGGGGGTTHVYIYTVSLIRIVLNISLKTIKSQKTFAITASSVDMTNKNM